ncbi:TolC family protein [Xanthomonas fragariae]|uniref:Multidrug efflux pump outer membrane protein n=2 Tax=Xanthomonas fragariae TaxID=48664 RepID=A0A1Y6H9J2_9XANT|nr:TolC family protein [Xanthomonas fragariae]AOD14683.1 multidrug transporter [Xanthomonas fragariae]AOD18077.1 multidrug transporter [Xanthomonas fragariae]ENZ96289.1 outer membrane component of multidrug efflux pump [Xanthomonas fragariae LMG 25863]MBL9195909.1 TolC family protein [Xanthomonas fragariae]MBL9220581.1 TolC family protein [Xanthomonas fragariae]
MIRRLVVLLIALAPGVALAHTTPLTLAEVLQSSARTAPQIVESLAKVRQAQGKGMSANGAFDTVFDIDARSREAGYYDGAAIESSIKRPFDNNGGYYYGGYRSSRGAFPVYEDKSYTDRGGEVKVGALYALLRDRVVDERRSRRSVASSDINVAQYEAEMVAIGVQRRAVDAYQSWVAAGLKLHAYNDLLQLAEQRRNAISRQVTLGARPTILLTENDQNLVRRRALVVRSEQEFATAANALSLYLRDEAGMPLIVSAERLPADTSSLEGLAGASKITAPVERPDYRAVLTRIDQATARLMLAQNDLKPRLDVSVEVSKDLGAPGVGGPNRSPTDAVIGFRFSVPLENRAAKGRVAEARAEIEALDQRSRFLRDQISVEVESVVISLNAAERLAKIADEERSLADRLAAAERRRFELGSGDFFLVNQREETANDARLRLIDAQARIASARAELAAATADRDALQLSR